MLTGKSLICGIKISLRDRDVEVAAGVEVAIMKPPSVGVDVATVEVASPPKSELIDTLAEASDESVFGTILTIPILKNIKIRRIAPIMSIRSNVFMTHLLYHR